MSPKIPDSGPVGQPVYGDLNRTVGGCQGGNLPVLPTTRSVPARNKETSGDPLSPFTPIQEYLLPSRSGIGRMACPVQPEVSPPVLIKVTLGNGGLIRVEVIRQLRARPKNILDTPFPTKDRSIDVLCQARPVRKVRRPPRQSPTY